MYMCNFFLQIITGIIHLVLCLMLSIIQTFKTPCIYTAFFPFSKSKTTLPTNHLYYSGNQTYYFLRKSNFLSGKENQIVQMSTFFIRYNGFIQIISYTTNDYMSQISFYIRSVNTCYSYNAIIRRGCCDIEYEGKSIQTIYQG